MELEKIGRMQKFEDRRDTKVLIQSEKFLCMPGHPMKDRFQDLALGRLKRSSFIHRAKRLRRHTPDLPKIASPLTPIPEQTTWLERASISMHIQTNVPEILDKEEQNSIQHKNITLSYLDDRYPQDFWVRVYTDGSAQDAVKN
jgi:hypothetical protein